MDMDFNNFVCFRAILSTCTSLLKISLNPKTTFISSLFSFFYVQPRLLSVSPKSRNWWSRFRRSSSSIKVLRSRRTPHWYGVTVLSVCCVRFLKIRRQHVAVCTLISGRLSCWCEQGERGQVIRVPALVWLSAAVAASTSTGVFADVLTPLKTIPTISFRTNMRRFYVLLLCCVIAV